MSSMWVVPDSPFPLRERKNLLGSSGHVGKAISLPPGPSWLGCCHRLCPASSPSPHSPAFSAGRKLPGSWVRSHQHLEKQGSLMGVVVQHHGQRHGLLWAPLSCLHPSFLQAHMGLCDLRRAPFSQPRAAPSAGQAPRFAAIHSHGQDRSRGLFPSAILIQIGRSSAQERGW